MMKKFIIIDASAIIYRSWFALPKLTDAKGKVINAAYGFSSLLLKILREERPDYLAIAYDTKAPSFRSKEFPEYKANRVPQPQEFYDQIPLTKDILKTFSINFFAQPGYEADDLISTLKKQADKSLPPHQTLVFTGDRDLLQLVDERTKIALLKQNISQTKIYGKEEIIKEYKLTPAQLIDFKALVGDPADNIPGVKGIGPNIALKLLKKFGNLENLYQAITNNKIDNQEIKERTINQLIASKKQVFLFKKIVTLKNNLQLKNLRIKDCRVKKIDKEKIKKLFNNLGFKSLIPRLEAIDAQQKFLF